MTTSREIACHRFGHDWTPWGLWQALWPEGVSPAPDAGAAPAMVEVAKVRSRRCGRCGRWQDQDGGGKITDREPSQ